MRSLKKLVQVACYFGPSPEGEGFRQLRIQEPEEKEQKGLQAREAACLNLDGKGHLQSKNADAP